MFVAFVSFVVGEQTLQELLQRHERAVGRHLERGQHARAFVLQMLVPEIGALVRPRCGNFVLIRTDEPGERVTDYYKLLPTTVV